MMRNRIGKSILLLSQLLLPFVVALGISAIVGSGGGASDNSGDNSATFRISNLSTSAITVIYNRETTVMTQWDVENLPMPDTNSSITISFFDDNNDLISAANLDPYSVPSEEDADYASGTMSAEIVFDGSIPVGKYTFQIYVTSNATKSNSLQGNLIIREDPWKIKAAIPIMGDLIFTAAGSLSGKIYTIGGGSLWSNIPEDVLAYDIETDTWNIESSMPTLRARLAAGAVNGKIYAFGGIDKDDTSLDITEEYDPATHIWTTKSPMPNARHVLASAVVNGKIYAIGGIRASDPDGYAVNLVEEYDPLMDTWTMKTSMPTARGGLGAAVVDGKIYAIGGYGSHSVLLDVVEVYDPITDKWTTKSHMPAERSDFAVGAANGKIYVIGGTNYDTVDEYDPITDTWSIKTPMPEERNYIVAHSENNIIYVMGGYIGAVYAYDPSKDQ